MPGLQRPGLPIASTIRAAANSVYSDGDITPDRYPGRPGLGNLQAEAAEFPAQVRIGVGLAELWVCPCRGPRSSRIDLRQRLSGKFPDSVAQPIDDVEQIHEAARPCQPAFLPDRLDGQRGGRNQVRHAIGDTSGHTGDEDRPLGRQVRPSPNRCGVALPAAHWPRNRFRLGGRGALSWEATAGNGA